MDRKSLGEDCMRLSDGSSSGPVRSGWGYALHRASRLIGSGAGMILGAEVYDAELLGAYKALGETVILTVNFPVKVPLDNSEAVHSLRTGRSELSQATLDPFTTLSRIERLVEIRWIPGHSDILGNIHADKLAKSALKDAPVFTNTLVISRSNQGQKFTFAELNRYVRDCCGETIEAWWRKNRPSRYKVLEI